MLCAASDSSAARDFYRCLLESELIVLGTRGERLAIDVVKSGAGFFHTIFTSPARLTTFSSEVLSTFSIKGRALFEATGGARFIVNPRSSPAKILNPDEIAWCLENFRPAAFSVLKPEIYPARLVKALCVLFMNRSQLQSARLTYVAPPGKEDGARIVIGIEADGDIPRLVEEIFTAAAVTEPDFPVDVASLDTNIANHPLHKHLLTVEPFYRREACYA
nr:enhanced serine sensitivity protein SseB C-terminal domain-containing protein [Rhizomicrobium electricum]